MSPVATQQQARGSTLRSTLAFVRSLAGEGLERVLARVPAGEERPHTESTE